MNPLNKLTRKFALVIAALMGLAGACAAADYPSASGKNNSISKKKTDKTVRRAALANKRPAAKSRLARAEAPTKPSVGQLAGLHEQRDELHLKSSAVLVMDQDTKEILFRKNDQVVLPIASLTKLMTGVLISEAQLSLDEPITITQDDVDTEKGSHSRLSVGTELSRGELLHLALMSSENRAAHALGRTYPGGLTRFVGLMNQKAASLGMRDTSYVEPTGLSSSNRSSAKDLANLVSYAHADPTLRELSTSPGYQVAVGRKVLQYRTTNRLVKDPEWDIGLQKTGYISEAGQCLVMQTKIAGRKLIMVFLDSAGKLSRIADAERMRHWLETNAPVSAKTSPVANVWPGSEQGLLRIN
jgi:D-alanyl-D-alanine endopeptidase (penicillin-binding protein 7)